MVVEYRRVGTTKLYIHAPLAEKDAAFVFLLRENASNPPTIEFPQTWSRTGAYAVVPRDEERDWPQFAAYLEERFATTGARIAWFDRNLTALAFARLNANNELAALIPHREKNLAFEIVGGTKVTIGTDRLIFASGGFTVSVNDDVLGLAANATLSLLASGEHHGSFETQFALSTKNLVEARAGQCLYEISDADAPEVQLEPRFYPIFKGDSAVCAEGIFDLNALDSADRTYFELTAPAATHFATDSGHNPLLMPDRSSAKSGRLVLGQRAISLAADGEDDPVSDFDFYLQPYGDFVADLPAHALLADPAQDHQLVCGNSGSEVATFRPGDIFAFEAGNALIHRAPSGPAVELTEKIKTSWIRVKPNASPSVAFFSAADEASLYGDRTAQGSLRYAPQRVGVFADNAAPLLPMFPINGIVDLAEVERAKALEAELLTHTRRALMEDGSARPAALTAESVKRTTTPQGFLVDVAPSGRWEQITLATTTRDNVPNQPFGFTNIDGDFRDSLLRNSVFLIASQLGEMDFLGGIAKLSVAGWQLHFKFPKAASGKLLEAPLLIVKFHEDSVEKLVKNMLQDPAAAKPGFPTSLAPDREAVLKAVHTFICDARRRLGRPCPGEPAVAPDPSGFLYERFVEAVSEPKWNGILALNWTLDVNFLPKEIQGLLIGIDQSKLRVHHVGIEANRIGDHLELSQCLPFGLLDYRERKPWTDIGSTPTNPPKFTFEVPQLQVLFDNGELRHFAGQIAIGLKSLFDQPPEPVKPSTTGFDAHTFILDGRYEKRANGGVYTFSSDKTYKFEIKNSVLTAVTLRRIQYVVQNAEDDAGSTRVRSRISITGDLSFGKLAEDWLSLSSLGFDDLGLSLDFLTAAGHVPGPIRIDFGMLRFDLSRMTKRSGSLLAGLPLQLKSLLVGQAQASGEQSKLSLSSLGYLPISGDGSKPFKFGLVFDLDLGTLGKLVAAAKGLRVEILLGWFGNDVVAGVKLPAGSGGRKELGIQGVFRLILEKFEFAKVTAAGNELWFVRARGAHLEILGKRLPPSGDMGFLWFVDPSGRNDKMAWFGGFHDKSTTPAVFALDFLGFGQRFRPVTGSVGSCDEALTGLEALVTKKPAVDYSPAELTQHYDPEGGWLVATKFSVLEKLVELKAVFYDAGFYCLGLSAQVGSLKIAFEILYRKITDDIGVFAVEIESPWRRFDLGAATVTLPNLGLSIYTNGDFKVDVGFPRNLDFSRSFHLEILPFTGAGGFYVAKLSGKTTDLLPGNPSLKTIFQCGIALRVGLGKTIEAGILKGGISVTVFGILEGALGYRGKPDLFKPDDYALIGTVGIIGEVYAVVHFGIARAEVNIRVSFSVGFHLRYQRRTRLFLEARVEVRLRVVIGGFKIFGKRIEISISFHFQITLRQEWYIGSGSTAQALTAATTVQAPQAIAWAAGYVHDVQYPLPLVFMVEVIQAEGAPHCVPMLAVRSSLASSEEAATSTAPGIEAFDRLLMALVGWTLRLHLNTPTPLKTPISLFVMDVLNESLHIPITLARTASAPLSYETLARFLKDNFKAEVVEWQKDNAPAAQNIPHTFFALAPDVTLTVTGDGAGTSCDIWTHATYTEGDQDQLADFFRELYINFAPRTAGLHLASDAAPRALAEILFTDYFDFLIKGTCDEVRRTLREEYAETDTPTLEEVFAKMIATRRFAQVANAASRFFLQGLRIPAKGTKPADGKTTAIFAESGQQFPLQATATSSSVSIAKRPSTPANRDWFGIGTAVAPSITLPIATNTATKEVLRQIAATKVEPQLYDLARLAYLRERPTSYRLSSRLDWDTQGSIYRVPNALLSRVLRGGFTAKLAVDRPDAETTSRPVAQDWQWATTVTLTLTRAAIPAAGGQPSKPLARTYAIGGASESDRRFLDALFEASNTPSIESIHLLHRKVGGEPGEVEEDQLTKDVFIVRANLSKQSTPPPGVAALNAMSASSESPLSYFDDKADFVRLIRECSIVNTGGYYLHYQTDNTTNGDLDPSLFDGSDARAEISLLIKWGTKGDVVPAYANAVWASKQLTDDPDEKRPRYLHLLSLQEPQLENAVEPGCIGFRVYRKKPESYSTAVEQQLQRHYSLVDYQISGTGFERLPANSVLPLHPTDVQQDSLRPDETWDPSRAGALRYEHFIPIHRFVSGGSGPYAGMGTEFLLELGIRDLFGNRLPQTAAKEPLKLEYFDPILSVSMWTAVSMSYEATKAGELSFTLSFDPSVFNDANGNRMLCDGKPENRVCAAIALYKRIEAQLTDRGLHVFARTTLSNEDIDLQALKADLIAFTQEILAYLCGGTKLPSARVVKVAAPLTNKRPLFELVVALGFYRPRALVANEAQPPPPRPPSSVERVVAVVPPKEGRAFIDGLEKLYAVKLASGVRYEAEADELLRAGAGAATGLWVVRHHMVNVTVAQNLKASYFAPRPIANRLLSRTVEYDLYHGATTERISEDVKDVDIDVLARACFAAIEDFLAPHVLVPAQVMCAKHSARGEVERVIEAKRVIATKFAQLVEPLFEGAPADSGRREEAQKAFENQLRIDLRSAYGIDCIVQFDATKDAAYPAGKIASPRLYGQVVSSKTPNKQLVLNASKVELKDQNPLLTVLVNSVPEPSPAKIDLELAYRITHVEYRPEGVPPPSRPDEYESTAWLQLLTPENRPITPASGSSVQLPIPVRRYPQLPAIREQDGESTRGASVTRIGQTRLWTYSFDYERAAEAAEAVDSIHVELRYIGDEVNALTMATSPLASLVAFERNLAPIRSVIGTIAAGTADAAAVALAVKALATLASAVAEAMGPEPKAAVSPLAVSGSPGSVRSELFKITDQNGKIEMCSEDTPPLKGGFLAYDPSQGAPPSEISNPSKCRSVSSTAATTPWVHRRVLRRNLDVMRQENAHAGIWLVRNEDLMTAVGLTTAAAFKYTTPLVQFIEPFTPLIEHTAVIDVSYLSSTQKLSLADWIKLILEDLFKQATGRLRRIQWESAYSFAPTDAERLSSRNAPKKIVLSPTLDVVFGREAKAATQIATDIEAWATARKPRVEGGCYVFSVSVFGAHTQRQQPVLRLRKLMLPLSRLK